MRTRRLSRTKHHALHTPLYVPGFRAILALLTLMLATGWIPAPQADETTVAGQVTNGTSSGIVPVDLEVTLRVFSEMEEKGTYITTLAADGTFRFDGLALEEGDTFLAQVVYQDVAYASEFVTFEPGQEKLPLSMTVYDTTKDLSAIQVTQMHIFLSMVGDRVRIGEYYLVSNTADRTYVGEDDPETGRRITLSFALPQGAEGLSFDRSGLGERYLEQEGGFADTEPIVPGTATVETLFSYELLRRDGMQVERAFDVPVTSVVILLSDEGMALEGDGLVPAGTLDTQMGPALSYTAGPLVPGESLVFSLVDRPQAAMPSVPPVTSSLGSPLNRNTAREISVGLVALAAAVAVGYLLWQPSIPQSPPARAHSLVKAIAALDADFEAGQVSEKSYHQKRGALKRRLRALLREDGRKGESAR